MAALLRGLGRLDDLEASDLKSRIREQAISTDGLIEACCERLETADLGPSVGFDPVPRHARFVVRGSADSRSWAGRGDRGVGRCNARVDGRDRLGVTRFSLERSS